jgi:hypothetical protein
MSRRLMLSELQQEIQQKLKEIEVQNIQQRTVKFVEVVNERARKLVGNCPPFELKIDAVHYVNFINKFKGVKVRVLKKTICSMEYGKTWLNGRRAIIYSKTLFVTFLDALEEYSRQLACWKENDQEMQSYLSLALRFDFLFGMLKSFYQPSNPHASVKPLICANALKNRFRETLQEWGLFENEMSSLDQIARISTELSRTYYSNYQQLSQKNNYAMSLDNCTTNLQGLNDVYHQPFVFPAVMKRSDLHLNPLPIADVYSPSFNLLNEYENLEQDQIRLQNEVNELHNKITELQNKNSELFFVFPENFMLKKLLKDLSDKNDFEIFA